MLRLALLAALCAAIPLCADDPPKKLTPEERKELDAKWQARVAAGVDAYRNGRYPEAEKAYQDALQIARQAYPKADFPDGHRTLGTTLNNLGALQLAQGRLEEAESLYKELLAMEKRLFKGDHPGVAIGMNNLAVVLKEQGKLVEVEQLLRDALDMNQRLFKGDHIEVARSLNNLAVVISMQGKLTDAERLSRQALEMRQRLFKGDHPDVANSLGNLAALCKDQDKLADAETLRRAALSMTRRLVKGDHPDLAADLSNLGSVLQERGKHTEAESFYREALEMRKRLFKGDHPRVAASLNALGTVLHFQLKHEEAESHYREALEMHRRLFKGDHPSGSLYRIHLAVVLCEQTKFGEAEPLFRASLEMNRRMFRGDHPELATNLRYLAGILCHQGKYAEAEPLAREALEMTRRLQKGDHSEVAAGLRLLAIVLRDRGKLEDADPLFRDALALYRSLLTGHAASISEGETLTLLASMPNALDEYLSNALALGLSPSVVYPQVWASKSLVARTYEQRLHAARAATDPTAAKVHRDLAETRRRRADLLLAPTVRDPATLKQREADIRELDARILGLEESLRPLLPAVERAEKLARATPAELQRAVPRDAAIMDFLRHRHYELDRNKPRKDGVKLTETYLAFVLTREQVIMVDLGSANAIEVAVGVWREAIISGKDIPATIPAKVRELVWEKVRKELPANIKTVYIAPDRDLCRVPWAALPGDKPGTILLEDFAVATIPHAPFLLDKLWPQDALKNPPSGSLVVGGVNFDAEATAGPTNRDLPIKPGTKAAWQALPGAAAEATGVETAAKKKGAVTSLKGEAATPAAVLAALPKAKHAHFATHGFFADPSFRSAFQLDEKDFQRTMRGERIGRAALSPLVMTGLVFAGANNPKTPGRGIVTGEALVDLDLSGLELAVLSACETGLGDVAGGEGTFGLQRAFHLAGTRDVIASLWKVPDAPTAALMAEFYRNLWERNLSPMESLRQAQLTIYRNPGKIAELAAGFRAGFKEVKSDDIEIKPTADGKAHPKLWAAFTLSGIGR